MKVKELHTALLLGTIYEKFNTLIDTVLDPDSSITLRSNNTGFFSVSYKDEDFGKVVSFSNLEDALKALDVIEKCSSIIELIDYLDV